MLFLLSVNRPALQHADDALRGTGQTGGQRRERACDHLCLRGLQRCSKSAQQSVIVFWNAGGDLVPHGGAFLPPRADGWTSGTTVRGGHVGADTGEREKGPGPTAFRPLIQLTPTAELFTSATCMALHTKSNRPARTPLRSSKP